MLGDDDDREKCLDAIHSYTCSRLQRWALHALKKTRGSRKQSLICSLGTSNTISLSPLPKITISLCHPSCPTPVLTPLPSGKLAPRTGCLSHPGRNTSTRRPADQSSSASQLAHSCAALKLPSGIGCVWPQRMVMREMSGWQVRVERREERQWSGR
ncbi:MAG: hypothetical protein L6R36_000544 [Xanthoria steineri]|nr:MAG: hypothetical protein L6R36_000544 [Xanthoria steineri]